MSGIHGDLSQHDRLASLEAFKTAETPLLVATDVAARGLDIPNVEYVINYTFPLSKLNCYIFCLTYVQRLRITSIVLDAQVAVVRAARLSRKYIFMQCL